MNLFCIIMILCSLLTALPAVTASPEAAASPTLPTTPLDKTTLPHVQVNQQERYIDLQATVVLREGDWLELLACSPNSREHEAILTLKVKPSHLHLALLMLGLEPGKPMSWEHPQTNPSPQTTSDIKRQVAPQIIPPQGPKIAVTLILPSKNNTAMEIPANRWILDATTQQPMLDNIWLFTGSSFVNWNGQRVYRADVNGTLLSLVNFGDDVLARPTELTSQNDNARWQPNTPQIPPVGTAITVRLRPMVPKK